MHATRLVALILAAVGAAATAAGQTVKINFDTDTAGNPVANGTVVDTLYSSWGVTFSHVGGACGSSSNDVFANNDQPSGFGSPPNVVSTCSSSYTSDISENGTGGLIQASFATGASSVCIDVRPDTAGGDAVMYAYDAGNNLIGTTYSTEGRTQTFCFSGTGIRSVFFSGDPHYNSYCRFDNLTVTFTQQQAIPLLSWPTLALLAAALGAVALWLLRRSA